MSTDSNYVTSITRNVNTVGADMAFAHATICAMLGDKETIAKIAAEQDMTVTELLWQIVKELHDSTVTWSKYLAEAYRMLEELEISLFTRELSEQDNTQQTLSEVPFPEY